MRSRSSFFSRCFDSGTRIIWVFKVSNTIYSLLFFEHTFSLCQVGMIDLQIWIFRSLVLIKIQFSNGRNSDNLYTQNLTRYPTGSVASTTSTWTIITDSDYSRPTTESYIRFKRLSDHQDVYRLNVVTELTNVQYLSDRLVITSSVIWTPGERYYIYFDSGVLALASTCTKPSMPIVDPTFWPFEIPYETTSTTTSRYQTGSTGCYQSIFYVFLLASTSTTSITSTLRPRTVSLLHE